MARELLVAAEVPVREGAIADPATSASKMRSLEMITPCNSTVAKMASTEIASTEVSATELPPAKVSAPEMAATEMPAAETAEVASSEMAPTKVATAEMPTSEMPTSEMSAAEVSSAKTSGAGRAGKDGRCYSHQRCARYDGKQTCDTKHETGSISQAGVTAETNITNYRRSLNTMPNKLFP